MLIKIKYLVIARNKEGRPIPADFFHDTLEAAENEAELWRKAGGLNGEPEWPIEQIVPVKIPDL